MHLIVLFSCNTHGKSGGSGGKQNKQPAKDCIIRLCLIVNMGNVQNMKPVQNTKLHRFHILYISHGCTPLAQTT